MFCEPNALQVKVQKLPSPFEPILMGSGLEPPLLEAIGGSRPPTFDRESPVVGPDPSCSVDFKVPRGSQIPHMWVHELMGSRGPPFSKRPSEAARNLNERATVLECAFHLLFLGQVVQWIHDKKDINARTKYA